MKPAHMKDGDPMSITEELVRAANPVRTSEVPPGDSPAARRLLATLPAPAPAHARRRGDRPARRARLALGGAALAAATAAIVTAVTIASGPAHPGQAGPAPRPGSHVPASVTGSLRELMLAAFRQPAVAALQPGQFQYTDSVSLNEVDT